MARAGKAKTNPQFIKTAERRAFVLELRKSGANYQQISEATIKKFGLGNLPEGWDERYAYKDISRELDRLNAELSQNTAETRRMELERLDSLMLGLWTKARQGNEGAVDRILKIMDRRARYLGLDAPTKVQFTWQDELLRLLIEGKITKEDVLNEFSDTPELAQTFFESAGIGFAGIGQAEVESLTASNGELVE